MKFSIRQAEIKDIDRIQWIRRAVKENVLSNASLVTNEDCKSYLTQRGKGWVAESGATLLGFAIADLQEDTIWALFLHPDFENRGIGKKLHDTMLDWYFNQGRAKVWLSTDPGTRAEGFYRKQNWIEKGTLANGEIKFEMTRDIWKNRAVAQ